MILIYSDSQILDLEWIPKFKFKNEYRICHSYDEYINDLSDVKIAFTTHRLHCDYDVNCPAYQGFEDKINKLSKHSNLVFTFESEIHNFHWGIWDKCFNYNVYWVLPGAVNDREDVNDHILYWGDWFKVTTLIYKQLPHKLEEVKPYVTKPKYFDALLGSPKPHRDFVFNAVNEHKLNDKFILTYGGKWHDTEFYAKDYFIWEPGTVPVGNIIGTADWVDYHGVRTGLSRVIPIQVFNDTAYSIIAETDHDNTLSFFSEKTVKPIIARRLFVAFTGYKFLYNLRTLGFQTFGDVIDESYDLEIDDNKRYTMAFEQVKRLCEMDQQDVYRKLEPVLEHNYRLAMERDWTQFAADKINEVIRSKT